MQMDTPTFTSIIGDRPNNYTRPYKYMSPYKCCGIFTKPCQDCGVQLCYDDGHQEYAKNSVGYLCNTCHKDRL